MTETVVKNKYFVFSDESGSWHDTCDAYVRAWVVVHESDYGALVDVIDYVNSEIGCTELKWKTIAGNQKFWFFLERFEYRIFLTISCPKDIRWESKYKITRNFFTQVESFDFGEIDSLLVTLLKKKMFNDIRNILFLKYYEKTHIENAKKGIDRILPARENLLIYRVDPPQMSQDGWRDILQAISPGVQIEFPKSHSDVGIQFADIIAGCVRSFLLSDDHYEQSKLFIPKFRNKLISKNKDNPNPNIIFFDETNDNLIAMSGKIWTV